MRNDVTTEERAEIVAALRSSTSITEATSKVRRGRVTVWKIAKAEGIGFAQSSPCVSCGKPTQPRRHHPRPRYCSETCMRREWKRRQGPRRSARWCRVDSYKRERGCIECGKTTGKLDFDHRPGTLKVANVADLVKWGSEAEMWAEIAKCDIRCASCHRTRHNALTPLEVHQANGRATRKPVSNEEIRSLRDAGLPVKEIATRVGLSWRSVYRRLAEEAA